MGLLPNGLPSKEEAKYTGLLRAALFLKAALAFFSATTLADTTVSHNVSLPVIGVLVAEDNVTHLLVRVPALRVFGLVFVDGEP